MKAPIFFRFTKWLLCLSLVFGPCGPIDFTPSTEAATSKEKRKTRKLKKDNRKLKKQNQSLRMQLAAALAASGTPVPVPPFIEMVAVGNPGNGTDAGNTIEPNTYGMVAEAFQIGKYEVTNVQYAAFLNAVAATNPNGLFDSRMETDERGGIDQFGASLNFRYAVRAGMGDKPVIWVDFWDCCRFCNWLHNGRPTTGVQDDTTTEDGAYTLTPAAIAANSVMRKPGAKFFLPTEDQWYKAAYYDPRATAAGGPPGNDNYWLYPMQSDGPGVPTEAAVNAIGEIDPDTANIANYNNGAEWDSNGDETDELGNVTAVGSGGPGSSSYYGACDMGGNVQEWNEGKPSALARKARGGTWKQIVNLLRSLSSGTSTPVTEGDDRGFRIASP